MLSARQSHGFHRSKRRGIVTSFVTAALLATSLGGFAAAHDRPAADPAVINDWNAVAFATIVTDAGKANAEAFMWFGFESAAVYNAVNGITGRYELYKWHPRDRGRSGDGSRGASPQAAAAAAAHRLLSEYFPNSQGRLDAALVASLGVIPAGRAKEKGIAFGVRAAEHIINLRVDDGRFAPITFTVPPGPGVWRPTLPADAPFFNPWMAKMRPLLLKRTSQFRPDGPPALTSRRYARDFNEVKEVGALNSATRTQDQTDTALYIAGMTIPLASSALRDLATRRHMDISEAARLFAAVDMSMADAIGVSWDSKLKFALWRPITAIRLANTDGNAATVVDTGWLPKVANPPYPDYTSGLTTITGAAVRALTRVLGTRHIDLNLPSSGGATRHYELASELNQDAIDARVWSGIHFRFADEVGSRMGKQVGDWALDHYFKRTRGGDH